MIELKSISKGFCEPNGTTRVLFQDLSMRMPDEIRSIAILGRSGSGKTTLLRLLAGLSIQYSGEYWFNGELLPKSYLKMAKVRNESIGFVDQACSLLDDRNVLRNVEIGLSSCKERRQLALEALDRVGMTSYKGKKVKELSGGELQRIAIARAIAKRPKLLLADEPTGSLDEKTESEVLGLFEMLKKAGTSLVIATHSAVVAKCCDACLQIQDGKLCQCGDVR